MSRTRARAVASSGKIVLNRQIAKKIRSGDLKIAVYGLGHVGSTIASAWLRAGASVIGVDKSSRVIENARKGRAHVPEPGVSEAFSAGLKEKRFFVYEDPIKASSDSFLKMICVPVLLTDLFTADLAAVREVASTIARGLKRGDVVSLNPSVPPGTSEDVVVPILEKESGLSVENDFFMLYNPERIYEGRAIEDIEERYPAVIAGAGPKSLEIGGLLCSMIFRKGVITIGDMRTAETEKLLEGVYRDVNIALANEMAKFCESIGVDFWEAREAANSQPFSHIHKPGVGVGGACIPVYPQFVLQTAAAHDVDCNITRLGRNTNDSMPSYCVEQASRLVGSINGSRVAVLGLAFRGGVSDTRLSPTYSVIDALKKKGAKEIRVHDPLVKSDERLDKDIKLSNDLKEAVKDTDLVILVADHAEYKDLSSAAVWGAPVYDGRGILNKTKFPLGGFASIGRAAK